MSRIKIHRREGQPVTNTIGHDRLIFEFDRPDGTIGTLVLIVSNDGNLWFDGIPKADPGVPGAIWVDAQGFVRASPGEGTP